MKDSFDLHGALREHGLLLPEHDVHFHQLGTLETHKFEAVLETLDLPDLEAELEEANERAHYTEMQLTEERANHDLTREELRVAREELDEALAKQVENERL